jgi:hypothetical protein
MFDLFGNPAPQGVKAAPDALSREIESSTRDVLRPKDRPARNPDARGMVDKRLRALSPESKIKERGMFRARALYDAGILTRKSARAMGLLQGLNECYSEPDRMRKGIAHWVLEGRIVTKDIKV